MAAVTASKFATQIVYFEEEGRQNLDEVLRVVKRFLKRRFEMRSCKIVIFTAEGQGPALCHSRLAEFDPSIIAVTFPRNFCVRRSEGEPYCPQISEKVMKYFKGVGIEVLIPPRLPFDRIEGLDAHNQQMKQLTQTIAIFGSGLSVCVQAVLLACDSGLVQEGETVLALSGDSAGVFTASYTSNFLSPTKGLFLREILCKARSQSLSRPKPEISKVLEATSEKRL